MSLRQEFSATGSSQKISLFPGLYLFECCGATGGDSGSAKGASGAYVSGVINIKTLTNFYVYVGKKGTHGNSSSFNGGGRGSNNGASGGGATDIRLVDKQDFSGLRSRIIVASGGGGANKFSEGCTGGTGGIVQGQPGIENGKKGNNIVPTGGTQVSGGEKGYPIKYYADWNGTSGSFGNGGTAAVNKRYGSGGGGGYFGGGGGNDGPDSTTSGAGGSSYISGYNKCLAISKSMTDINSPIMLDHSKHYSGFFFRNITVKEGSELKRDGDGYAIITFLHSHGCSFPRCYNKHDLFNIAMSIIMTVQIK